MRFYTAVKMMDSLYETPENMKLLKRNMTLDFNSPTNDSKKIKFLKTCQLESPDLNKLKMATPDMERMIIQNGLMTATPTPSGIMPYFLKQDPEITEEQEEFAKGFEDALEKIHQSNGHQESQPVNGIHNHGHHHNHNSHQINNHSQNHTINSYSSDSSSDLTIAEHNNSNNNNRLNSNRYITNSSNNFTPLSTSVATSAVTTFAANKFAIPSIPPQEQYVSISQTNGGEIVSTSSVLPTYSAAVNTNPIYPMTIKMESQKPLNPQSMSSHNTCTRGLTPPLSPQQHMAPIDMADQERIKLERKRLRNRIAASKCRRRKLERISRLEDKVKGLKGENSELSVVVNKLRDQVCGLKQQVMDHVKCGCQLLVPQ